MNADSYLTLVVAVLCVLAAGVSATTLQSTVTQNPDDVVNFDYKNVPLGRNEGESIKNAVQGNDDPGQRGGKKSGDAPSHTRGDTGQKQQERQGRSSAGSAQGASDSQGPNHGQSGGGSGNGDLPGTRGLLAALLKLLRQLLPLLVLVVLLALAYRYRDTLVALALAVVGAAGRDGTSTDERRRQWPNEEPPTEVHRAWLAMVDRLDLDRPWTRTPDECAAAALEADMDPGAVRTLTDVFEEVRYGGAPVTEDRRRRAREGIANLGDGRGSGST
ncbi:MAG: DUF4129 domain-containing protein [Haloarculaceae archaeon]